MRRSDMLEGTALNRYGVFKIASLFLGFLAFLVVSIGLLFPYSWNAPFENKLVFVIGVVAIVALLAFLIQCVWWLGRHAFLICKKKFG